MFKGLSGPSTLPAPATLPVLPMLGLPMLLLWLLLEPRLLLSLLWLFMWLLLLLSPLPLPLPLLFVVDDDLLLS